MHGVFTRHITTMLYRPITIEGPKRRNPQPIRLLWPAARMGESENMGESEKLKLAEPLYPSSPHMHLFVIYPSSLILSCSIIFNLWHGSALRSSASSQPKKSNVLRHPLHCVKASTMPGLVLPPGRTPCRDQHPLRLFFTMCATLYFRLQYAHRRTPKRKIANPIRNGHLRH